MKNSNFKAEFATRLFDSKCLSLGYITSEPIVDVRYDRIVDKNGKLFKVQIKYCARKSTNSKNAFYLNLRGARNGKITSKNGYSKKDIDVLVVYLPANNKLYWFPPKIFHNKQFLSLRISKTKNNQKYFDISKYEF